MLAQWPHTKGCFSPSHASTCKQTQGRQHCFLYSTCYVSDTHTFSNCHSQCYITPTQAHPKLLKISLPQEMLWRILVPHSCGSYEWQSSEVIALKLNVFCFLLGVVGKMSAKAFATSLLAAAGMSISIAARVSKWQWLGVWSKCASLEPKTNIPMRCFANTWCCNQFICELQSVGNTVQRMQASVLVNQWVIDLIFSF